MSPTPPESPATGKRPVGVRARPEASWEERCSTLFVELRAPARAMVARAYRGALTDEEIEDIYSAAWAATLVALRGRERQLDDEELRSYLLAAVANQASKEMRRRSRRPAGSLGPNHAQVLHDGAQPSPEERALGSESASVVRDLLSSLPPRRRAVMLLRYGWGLAPDEVCGLISNLSRRAYRKEITRGVQQLVDRLRQVESGEWCRSREPLLRDYIAGVATEESRRQAVQHIAHCRGCAELARRLDGSLGAIDASVAWTAAGGAIGERELSVGERLVAVLDRVRGGATEKLAAADDRAADAVGAITSSGGTRGAGLAGAGVLAKLAGLGAAGKTAVGCLGAGAAATICVAAGVVPGVELPGLVGGPEPAAEKRAERAPPPMRPEVAGLLAGAGPGAVGASAPHTQAGDRARRARREERRRSRDGDPVDGTRAYADAPAGSPAPAAPAVDHEFGLEGAAASGSGSGTTSSSGSGGGGSGGTPTSQEVSQEFGP